MPGIQDLLGSTTQAAPGFDPEVKRVLAAAGTAIARARLLKLSDNWLSFEIVPGNAVGHAEVLPGVTVPKERGADVTLFFDEIYNIKAIR